MDPAWQVIQHNKASALAKCRLNRAAKSVMVDDDNIGRLLLRYGNDLFSVAGNLASIGLVKPVHNLRYRWRRHELAMGTQIGQGSRQGQAAHNMAAPNHGASIG